MKVCAKCKAPTTFWWGDMWLCWKHFWDITAVERVRVSSLTLSDIAPMMESIYHDY